MIAAPSYPGEEAAAQPKPCPRSQLKEVPFAHPVQPQAHCGLCGDRHGIIPAAPGRDPSGILASLQIQHSCLGKMPAPLLPWQRWVP